MEEATQHSSLPFSDSVTPFAILCSACHPSPPFPLVIPPAFRLLHRHAANKELEHDDKAIEHAMTGETAETEKKYVDERKRIEEERRRKKREKKKKLKEEAKEAARLNGEAKKKKKKKSGDDGELGHMLSHVCATEDMLFLCFVSLCQSLAKKNSLKFADCLLCSEMKHSIPAFVYFIFLTLLAATATAIAARRGRERRGRGASQQVYVTKPPAATQRHHAGEWVGGKRVNIVYNHFRYVCIDCAWSRICVATSTSRCAAT